MMTGMKTLREVFNAAAEELGVVVLRGEYETDAHAHTFEEAGGETAERPAYVMLPGGNMPSAKVYAVGLHELGHVAVRRTQGKTTDTEKLADDMLSGKRGITDTLRSLFKGIVNDLEHELARAVTARLKIAPVGAWTDVVNQEFAAWDWATQRATRVLSGAELRIFEATRTEGLQTYVDGAVENAREYYTLVAQNGQSLVGDRLKLATREAIDDYASGKPEGCGVCPSCVRRDDRKVRASKLYEQTVSARKPQHVPDFAGGAMSGAMPGPAPAEGANAQQAGTNTRPATDPCR